VIENGVEVVLISTRGGPYPGKRFLPITQLAPAWPPPDEIPAPGGKYVKTVQSELPHGSHPNVARGAEYEWEADPC
jgi:hypothetical protein